MPPRAARVSPQDLRGDDRAGSILAGEEVPQTAGSAAAPRSMTLSRTPIEALPRQADDLDTRGDCAILLSLMTAKRSNRRRRYVVGHPFQVTLVNRLLTGIFALAVLSSLVAVLILYRSMDQPDIQTQAHLMTACVAISITLLSELIIAIPLVRFLAIRESHAVVGPIRHIVRAIDAMSDGDYSHRLHLRKGDTLTEIADAINRLAERYDRRGSKK